MHASNSVFLPIHVLPSEVHSPIYNEFWHWLPSIAFVFAFSYNCSLTNVEHFARIENAKTQSNVHCCQSAMPDCLQSNWSINIGCKNIPHITGKLLYITVIFIIKQSTCSRITYISYTVPLIVSKVVNQQYFSTIFL